SIGLTANLAVVQGQSATMSVILSKPAPSGGATITLSSGSMDKVTISPATVFIATGRTQPSVQPQVTGVDVGSSEITAMSPGFTQGGQSVQVVAPLSITTVSLSNGQLNAFYSQPLTAAGGTGANTWAIIAGVLPNGLTLNGTTGVISGTPLVTVTNTPLTI